MSKCLVTGGAGFIGSNLVDGLVACGHDVRVFDNLSTGKRENLAQHGSKIELAVGDLRNPEAIMNAVQGMDYVFHMAALRAVLRSVDNPMETNDVNVTGTLNVLIASKEAGVKRLVFTSSSSVYGDTEEFPLKETSTPNPQSPYAASKIMGEYYSKLFTRLYGLETVSLRYFNVFGPRQNPESVYSAVIPIFIDALLKKQSPEIHWDGKQSRDFSFVDNVVEGNLCAMTAPGVAGEVFNIACHEEYSVLDIFNGIKEILKIQDIEPVFKPKRAGDVRRTFADISKSEKLLGFKVQTRFKEGLAKTVEWFLSSGVLK
ncbi:MAG: Vi polysaccharide biosynthesis protein VipB/TviC [Omnitrophica bacterium RIFCSPLOWO2_12_FULL_44_17]|uniref:Vi polysaccharide biosynthesis protein VipB/TviC n=1 Tax=Candidatus Danuiimicrobium aquiferis TaxID=1801832 RepID=A0A1G1KRB4_9BACT|nr:MAG: Vi polysaccharide biosynthesis protein VipB/TviC [Omnitrophica bacterium RIFCSPHIGHO2_02_FULL_45_28]OGW90744.1 MAG: Vi polysaccharide biosynthesis protein VipB/TviC [Omnitrophica bacterium RIFCSPHIGHO2_12_FULL_44_12]OGW95448.1 MAG: Vi polysaccharide biosynthesis protein VipB/TviC [Omnitrophica bacterium RIFCSPLOWO2_12_FULL_44_17]OGX03328.1 MAG: Vi polysaccharide biosynthesis protein VipB/TviC [Omnitrophica bacterium RIFCSPLOWO2_02_FULL_44_11]